MTFFDTVLSSVDIGFTDTLQFIILGVADRGALMTCHRLVKLHLRPLRSIGPDIQSYTST